MDTIATTTEPAAPPRVTPEDLLRMGSDGKRYELVDGKLEELAVGFLSSYVAGEVCAALKEFVKPRRLGLVLPEGVSYQCFPDDPGKVRRADTSFIARGRWTIRQAASAGHVRIPPDIAVEVISPNDYAKLVNLKIEEWLKAGVRLVWVLDPDAKVVFCHELTAVATRREGDTLTGGPVLPGFAVPVADLFRLDDDLV